MCFICCFNVSCPPQALRPFDERPTICNCRANAHIHLSTAKMTFLMPYCRHNMRDKRQNVKKKCAQVLCTFAYLPYFCSVKTKGCCYALTATAEIIPLRPDAVNAAVGIV